MNRSGLRAAVLAGGVLLSGFGAATLAMGLGPGPLIAGLVVGIGVVFERWRYKALETRPPAGGFQPTAERFIDPGSKSPVTVYVDPVTGERKYVRD